MAVVDGQTKRNLFVRIMTSLTPTLPGLVYLSPDHSGVLCNKHYGEIRDGTAEGRPNKRQKSHHVRQLIPEDPTPPVSIPATPTTFSMASLSGFKIDKDLKGKQGLSWSPDKNKSALVMFSLLTEGLQFGVERAYKVMVECGYSKDKVIDCRKSFKESNGKEVREFGPGLQMRGRGSESYQTKFKILNTVSEDLENIIKNKIMTGHQKGICVTANQLCA